MTSKTLDTSPAKVKASKKNVKKKLLNYAELCHSDDDSSVFELDENNLYLCVNQARKVVPSPTSQQIIAKEEELEDSQEKKRMVVILRDFTLVEDAPECAHKLPTSWALKERLLTHKIRSYIIGIPGLLQDLNAIQIMKGYTENFPQMKNETAYRRLLLTIIQAKIRAKMGKVVIVNLEDKTNMCPLHLKMFCEGTCRAEVFTLDKTNSPSFDLKLDKLTQNICKFRNAITITRKSNVENKLIMSISTPVVLNVGNNSPQELDYNANEIQSDISVNCICNENSAEKECIEQEGVELEEIKLRPNELEVIILDRTDNNDQLQIQDEMSPSLVEQSDKVLETMIIDVDASVEYLPGTRLSDVKINEKSMIESDITNSNDRDRDDEGLTSARDCSNDNQVIQKIRKIQVRKKRRHLSSSRDVPDSGSDTGSEKSLSMSLVFAQRPKLFTIQLTADESRYPSSVFTRFPMVKGMSQADLSESNLYKGWIAVPTVDSASVLKQNGVVEPEPEPNSVHPVRNNLMLKIRPKLIKVGAVMKKAFQPIGSLFQCEMCKRSHTSSRKTTPERNDYPGIMLDCEAFDQKYG